MPLSFSDIRVLSISESASQAHVIGRITPRTSFTKSPAAADAFPGVLPRSHALMCAAYKSRPPLRRGDLLEVMRLPSWQPTYNAAGQNGSSEPAAHGGTEARGLTSVPGSAVAGAISEDRRLAVVS